jgi:hypothetical protein
MLGLGSKAKRPKAKRPKGQKVIPNNPFNTSPQMSSPYMVIEGRLYINSPFGVITAKDYLTYLQISELSKKKVSFDAFDMTEVAADYTQLLNETATVSKEFIVRSIISYVNKYYTNTTYYMPVGSKYYEHHRYIIDALEEKLPGMKWSVMSKSLSQYMFRGVVS